MINEVDAYAHYEFLIDEGDDPVHDHEKLKEYMSNWDGPLFFNSLDLNKDKNVLEVGIGTGRVAVQVLNKGCKEFVGIDISPKTIKKAKENLSKYNNVQLIEQNILTFIRPNQFDIIYSVLTFLHIEDKALALKNIYSSLKKEGYFILSISKDDNWLDYGRRKVKLYPESKEYYIELLKATGFIIELCEETFSGFATIVKSRKN
ncbi:class I SAM-dependent DNA methyltransferase [Clostridium cellulovorans]|uniref:Methyltransferase type 11 n=1 Tax=Clostridium cellulovorans (strain ATCC 35296 / DSM 3052 / OCM 3 / 743B) TaxID=573061 RepID=D9ST22_CLOC7|nr:class I SAM-dependent methyltransferase [Clostridium cellulovorans]ADL52684.1 Methyltransferase type 11 [Clostridium cellulovorans 743B]